MCITFQKFMVISYFVFSVGNCPVSKKNLFKTLSNLDNHAAVESLNDCSYNMSELRTKEKIFELLFYYNVKRDVNKWKKKKEKNEKLYKIVQHSIYIYYLMLSIV